MNGKSKCKILKQIRKEIAKQNDIEYVTSECKFQGDCTGTCPKCEAEVRYLEQELAKRRTAGKAVAVAGIATAMLLTAAGCRPGRPEEGQKPQSNTQQTAESAETELQGNIAVDGEISDILMGEPVETTAGVPTEPLMGGIPPETVEPLMGDVPLETWASSEG